jgi:hypothetical protein
VVVEEVRVVQSTDSFSEDPQTLPVGIAEVGLPVTVPAGAAAIDTGCRDDLLTVDDRPVAIRITGSAPDAAGGTGVAVEGCDAPLALGAGEHVVRAADGRTTGLDLDQLVLDSPAAGAAPTTAPAPPVLTIADEGRSSYDLDVASIGGPFWLVLGQSHNLGWAASADGLGDLGPPRIVDGHANGWWVDPGGATTLRVALDWTPQRAVRGGLVASAVAALACLGLVLTGRRRAVVRPWSGLGLRLPQLISPVAGVGERPAPATVAGITAATGVAGAVLVRWEVGPIVGLLTLAALLWRWGRLALTGGAIGLLGTSAGYVILKQLRNGYPPDFGWPDAFDAAHLWTSVALVLLLADVAVGWARRRTTIF